MYKFSRRSLKNLSECHPLLIELFMTVIDYYDCTVIDGHRGKEEQNEAYHKGFSKLKYPRSKHNQMPSLAVDVVPYPILWNHKDPKVRKEYEKRMFHFVGFVKGIATILGIDIRYGADWDSDNMFSDQSFIDLPHFELKSSKQNLV